jgi:hypothetical protein
MGRPGFDFDGLLRMDMSFGGATHMDQLDDGMPRTHTHTNTHTRTHAHTHTPRIRARARTGFPGKRSLPRRDFDSDLDNASMVRIRSVVPSCGSTG